MPVSKAPVIPGKFNFLKKPATLSEASAIIKKPISKGAIFIKYSIKRCF